MSVFKVGDSVLMVWDSSPRIFEPYIGLSGTVVDAAGKSMSGLTMYHVDFSKSQDIEQALWFFADELELIHG